MARFRVYRDAGLTEEVEASDFFIGDGALVFLKYVQHPASISCECPDYERKDSDGNPKDHSCEQRIMSFGRNHWRKVARMQE